MALYNKRLIVTGLTALLLGLAMASPHMASAQAAQPAPSATADVAIRDFYFSPYQLSVPAGTTVRWTNLGHYIHTVTSYSGAFDSGPLNPGSVYMHTFSTPGIYPYYCAIHQALGMTGVIVVSAAQPPPSSQNLALGRPAYASSQQPGHGPALATDGSLDTEWRSLTLPAWIYVDLGRPTIVSRAILRWGPQVGYSTFSMYAYSGGGWWYRIYSGVHSGGVVTSARFPTVITRYVLLYNYRSGPTSVGLKEFELYGLAVNVLPIPGSNALGQPQGSGVLPPDLPSLDQ